MKRKTRKKTKLYYVYMPQVASPYNHVREFIWRMEGGEGTVHREKIMERKV